MREPRWERVYESGFAWALGQRFVAHYLARHAFIDGRAFAMLYARWRS